MVQAAQMGQEERLAWLVAWLVADDPRWAEAQAAGELQVPEGERELERLWRSLVNVREPRPVTDDYLEVEDAYLAARREGRGVVHLPASDEPIVWQGDITRLAVDGIVNAANSQLLGCFVPCHGCIDNAIHTAAGVRLRLACDELMRAQGAPEPCGRAKVTPGFNLPAAHVLHTVGPIVRGAAPTLRNRSDLASCYRSCLDLASEEGLRSVAFCCISTGEFRFPNRQAARIAVAEVRRWSEAAHAEGRLVPTVVFNVFKGQDRLLYEELLGGAR